MTDYRVYFLLTAATMLEGCNGFSVAPQWSCLTAKEPIEVFENLDRAGEQPQLIGAAGVIEAAEGTKIIDRYKLPSGKTTHFRVKTRDSRKVWLSWAGNEFTGWSGPKCW